MVGSRRPGDQEPTYSIGAVARMLEVPTSTLRGWENRYGLLAPGRSKGAHRLYSHDEVEQLRFIKDTLDSGVSAADAHRLLAQGRRAVTTAGGAFASRQAAGAGVGSVVLGGVHAPVHAHYPTFYATDEGRVRLAVPFLRDGLRFGQTCFLSAAGQVQDSYISALAQVEGLDIESAIRSGQLVVVDAIGRTVEECIAYWERSLWRAVDGGSNLVRVIGDMSTERELFPSLGEMMRYETAYNGVAKRFPTVTLCQYDVRVFDGEIVYEAFKSHPDTYDLRVGTFLS
ncbi:MAG TPA: MEDS domain-containing protein [Candidatus Dormibacteraeota bacterium]|nr:MEDS domain-containing protein [Candidatus Dormibacteraeota bacterium]